MIDEIDWNGNVIATHLRSYFKERMFLHRASFVMPTFENRIVVDRRAKEKFPYPDTWSCIVGGKVISGETDRQAAYREMDEEIGYQFPLERVGNILYDTDEFRAIISLFTNKSKINVEE